MAESTLSLSRSQLKASVGFYLGYGRGEDFDEPAWPVAEDNAIEQCVTSGLRRFYFPIQPSGGFYDWNFLRPISTQLLDSGATTVALPDDFGGIEGTITIAPSGSETGSVWWPIQTTNEGIVRQLYATYPAATGRPLQAAVVPIKGVGLSQGQRYQLYLYPTADQQYQLQFSYTILPDALTGNNPLPYGGAMHAETILEACLSVAEERLDDNSGVHAQSFARLLAASMKQDSRTKPQTIGYNGDQSDSTWGRYNWRQLNPISVQGVVY